MPATPGLIKFITDIVDGKTLYEGLSTAVKVQPQVVQKLKDNINRKITAESSGQLRLNSDLKLNF